MSLIPPGHRHTLLTSAAEISGYETGVHSLESAKIKTIAGAADPLVASQPTWLGKSTLTLGPRQPLGRSPALYSDIPSKGHVGSTHGSQGRPQGHFSGLLSSAISNWTWK